METFKDVFNQKKAGPKPPAYQWQDFALQIIDELGVPKHKRNSVFLVCKKHPKPYVERCLNETRELCKTGECWRYFFKVIESNKKGGSKPPEKAVGQD